MMSTNPRAAAQRARMEDLHPRSGTVQRKFHADEDELHASASGTVQTVNRTGLPTQLKTNIEAMSGVALDNVKVHYNSSQPAQLNALAYAQGADIHLGPGQEKHLPHEAWHVVQQAQGRVKPTLQAKGEVPVNDDAGLEREADEMGARALSAAPHAGPVQTMPAKKLASSGQPIQRIISVADFQAATPKTLLHGRGPNLQGLDAGLTAYIAARTSATALALAGLCAAYVGQPHQPARIVAATALLHEANAEGVLLGWIGNANAHLVDGLIAQIGGPRSANLPGLNALAARVGQADAHILPALVNLVTPPQLAAFAASAAFPAMSGPNSPWLLQLWPHMGMANIALLGQLVPLANGAPGLPALTTLIIASGGAAHQAGLVGMIPQIGGHAEILTLANMLTARNRTATQAAQLAAVAATDGALFARLCGELRYFQRAGVPGAGGIPANVTAAQNAYNAARDAVPAAALVTLHAQATIALNLVNAAIGGGALVPPAWLAGTLANANGHLVALGNNNGLIAGGAHPMIAAHRPAAAQLRQLINGPIAGAGGGAGVAGFTAAANLVTAELTNFDNSVARPVITTVSFDHYLDRHTAHYFNFGGINAANTQWPVVWGAGAAVNVGNELAAVLGALHARGSWLMPAAPQPGQVVGAGTAQIAGLVDGAVGTLRLGQFFPEDGAAYLPHDQATMNAIAQLV
ncbi:hypothetical protein RO07_25390 [Pandoraea pulmonicola]|nr:hypothetical protein RO07_25390 [Pandoraea pulmonicola]